MNNRKISRREMLKLMAAGSAGGLLAARLPGSLRARAQAKISVWLENNLIPAVDELNQKVFTEWGAANNVEVEFRAISNATFNEQLAAAVEAGAAPDIIQLSQQRFLFWQTRDQLIGVDDVLNDLKGNAGGIVDSALAMPLYKGTNWGITYGLDITVMHTRQDILDKAGVKYPATWEELVETAKAVQQLPDTYGWGVPLGNDGDCNITFSPIMWGYGGQLTNEDGSLAFKSPETLKAVELVAKAYLEDKIIPPGAVGWSGAGNNEAYLAHQLVFTYNSLSIYAAASTNDPELAKATSLNRVPAGPVGSFDVTQGWMLCVMKQSKNPEAAKDALRYFFEPTRYLTFIELGAGRTLPIYKDHLNSDFFRKNPAYANVPELLAAARIRSYPGPFSAAVSEFENTFVLPAMFQDICVNGKAPDKALDEAYAKAQEIWAKLGA